MFKDCLKQISYISNEISHSLISLTKPAGNYRAPHTVPYYDETRHPKMTMSKTPKRTDRSLPSLFTFSHVLTECQFGRFGGCRTFRPIPFRTIAISSHPWHLSSHFLGRNVPTEERIRCVYLGGRVRNRGRFRPKTWDELGGTNCGTKRSGTKRPVSGLVC